MKVVSKKGSNQKEERLVGVVFLILHYKERLKKEIKNKQKNKNSHDFLISKRKLCKWIW